eukprot:gene18262-21280_t
MLAADCDAASFSSVVEACRRSRRRTGLHAYGLVAGDAWIGTATAQQRGQLLQGFTTMAPWQWWRSNERRVNESAHSTRLLRFGSAPTAAALTRAGKSSHHSRCRAGPRYMA